ncbi:Putative F0F1-ATPase subunit [Anaerohalosphaera lusitana]|uniref:Putative F0F1-ATPase subunit n=1 Tax=Anaerohalosphaera lusitana TaxID=1936003 RepID=A0A1U9NNI7_9BACT|nr:AtpZ/AtpI family protein [Anaerohalosphaera lusitana]AQT69395.1 Putative F0F1-ATPase subunit [Anaerohalosphaera lusitana]
MSENNDQRDQNDRWAAFAWMGIGIEFCAVVGFFMWLGSKLDKLQDTFPGFMIIGFFVGFALMLYIMIQRAGGLKGDGSKNRGSDD